MARPIEAQDWIAAHFTRAATFYLDISKEKRLTVEELVESMTSKDLGYNRVPTKVGKILDFMQSVSLIKTKANSWKDLYLPETHDFPGI